jgi:hypothetical protein
MNLPTAHPAEALVISPEALEIANAYLTYQDTKKVSDELDISLDVISNVLNRREVKAYINNVFLDLGFNNRFKLRKAMDAIIAKKFQELDEADIGSSKDIADLLALSHKMTMDEMDKQIQLEKIREQNNIRSQVNVQINDGGSNYSSLLERIINADNK